MAPLTLESLEIDNFRAFDHLVIDRLGQVNLVVGRNSVGKTCLLEALQIYAQRAEPRTLQGILESRDEATRMDYKARFGEDERLVHTLSYLFNGWSTLETDPGGYGFSIGPSKSVMRELSVRLGWYSRQPVGEGESVWKAMGGYQRSYFDDTDLIEDAVAGIRLTFAEETIYVGPLRRLFDRRSSAGRWLGSKPQIPSVFVPASALDTSSLGKFWDNIALRDEEEDVIRGLNLIAPEVARITLVGDTSRRSTSRRIPVARIESLSEPIPLGSLGEGMMRLLNITLALANARDGLLLIDEIDSGLHYSVHKDLWRLIFEVATRLNIQVFATTHSWDCIRGFQQAAKEENYEPGLLIRLERRKGQIVPLLFDFDRLEIATRQKIEVR